MLFTSTHLTAAYFLDLLLGDPGRLPHPVRWIGHLITWVEGVFYDEKASSGLHRMAGCAFWMSVVTVVFCATKVFAGFFAHLHPYLGCMAVVWIAYTTLATRSLHQESSKVARALREGNLEAARQGLSRIVSRDTAHLGEKDMVRALVETVSENISDGIVAPLFYLALGGPVGGMVYKAVNTMDSMVGYRNERYRSFGWFSARMDDVANLVPARLSALALMAAAACMGLDWRNAWRIVWRDAGKVKSPNAGYPEAAAAGALNVQLGGPGIYFGRVVEKPYLGNEQKLLSLQTYQSMIRLMYLTSLISFGLALGVRYLIAGI